jgi:hypothetical protein
MYGITKVFSLGLVISLFIDNVRGSFGLLSD